MPQRRPFRCRRIAVQLTALVCLLVLACKTSAAPDDSATTESKVRAPAEKISDSWSRSLPIKTPMPEKNVGSWRAWVEEGWLLVERRTDDDEIEWKIVLAKVVGDEPPEIDGDQFGALRLDYDDGRYFIREYSTSDAERQFGCLRCRRQPKMSEKRWPTISAPPRDRPAPAAFSGSRQWSLSSGVSGSWLTVTAGPPNHGKQPSADFLMRLYHADLDVGAHGGSGGGDFLRQFYGKWFVEDDGELLIVNWLPESLLDEELKHHPVLAGQFATRKLAGTRPPDLAVGPWLNSEQPPNWKALHGKPVLLVLFDLKQQSFLPLVTPLLAFQKTYREQGLAVIGIHTQAARDEIEKRLAEEHIDFPVLIDDGKAEEQFGIGFSACLLIDGERKVVSVYKDSLAPPAEIEKLLEAKSDEQ